MSTSLSRLFDVIEDSRLPEGMWLVQGAGVTTIGSHEYDPEAFYAFYGFTRAPEEGRFAFRERCEDFLHLHVRDRNHLRERVYRDWKARQIAW